jgi:hypothetical protein
MEPGDTLYTVLRHRSASGMTRAIDLYRLTPDPDEPGSVDVRWLSRLAARALDWTFSERYEALSVGGCGMDMGYHIVYSLAAALWPAGFTCTGPRCPSNDHSNGDRDHTPHHHNDGGYALRHRWL